MSGIQLPGPLDRLLQAYIGLVGGEGYLIVGFVAVLWIVELANMALGHALSGGLGIRPRTAGGVVGIVLCPVLHFGPGHALANTPPLLVLATLVAFQDPGRLVFISAAIILVKGMVHWFVGSPNTVTAGASGLVFGYLGYLLVRGFQGGSPMALLIAIVVFLHYRYMLSGMLPWGVPRGVSWQGHLLGAAAGAATALHVSGVIVW